MSLLTDGKLARTIANALKGVMYPVTVRRTVPGSYDPETGGIGPGTTADFTVLGMVDSFSTQEIAGGLVEAGDKRVTILADGLEIVPTPSSDTIIANGNVLTVLSVKSDAARATWELRCL